jgi:hypothetical protein
MTDAETALRRSLVRLEREQHSVVLVEAATDAPGAYVARVQPAIERMRNRGLLSARQADAGARIYRNWALGICGARDADAGGGSALDPGGYRDRQLDAATEYRRIRDAVGLRLWPVTFGVCCEDMSVDQFANERGGGMDRKQWMGALKMALSMAADFLGLPD